MRQHSAAPVLDGTWLRALRLLMCYNVSVSRDFYDHSSVDAASVRKADTSRPTSSSTTRCYIDDERECTLSTGDRAVVTPTRTSAARTHDILGLVPTSKRQTLNAHTTVVGETLSCATPHAPRMSLLFPSDVHEQLISPPHSRAPSQLALPSLQSDIHLSFL